MVIENLQSANTHPPEWKRRWINRRNRIFANPAFQKWASALWPFSRVARKHASHLFDLVAGFTYSQTLLAAVEADLLGLLAQGPSDADAIAAHCDLSRDGALRLVRAAAALGLAEEVSPGWWMLGERGAPLHANAGAQAMIRHHKLLYADLADPLALLRADRKAQTQLSRFWQYGVQGNDEKASAYSDLMAVSQAMVAEQTLAAHDFSRCRSILDIGGGHGAFVSAVAVQHPNARLGIFDLPPVLEGTAKRLESAGLNGRVTLHPGDFFHTPLPTGYDCITLNRILHDHDDDAALALLKSTHKALKPGARLVIAEPMADTPGAQGMGDAYFGLYLWAMNSGRPRSIREIGAMLQEAGFQSWQSATTRQPVIASLIVSLA
ncbi:methyltransferase [Aurantiacibacter marinus]|uniref:Methyltransferase n=2 Tax=Aurantiacibacter marinus TaxID=874156 RepID=A0A0H0XRE7_9SPHN|nr:methyltransferase [Aurantiacibacter marinus]